eukprot:347567-Chlamydomonas_euryale.AAC.1
MSHDSITGGRCDSHVQKFSSCAGALAQPDHGVKTASGHYSYRSDTSHLGIGIGDRASPTVSLTEIPRRR